MIKIKDDKFYTPKEIIKFGIMSAKNEDTKKQMLLRFIRDGRIEALNLGTDNKPRYVVRGKELKDYMQANLKKSEYIKK